ncbi:predicted protein [Plenodomus lingam JN3]|uniref:Predicted protein n=1 Tax=Leptosphaeria maculans (strain JN3 / isolate v23.1.3 / race Av1-4-5-6-7-8) TaxID=985895 RepID=E4ZNN9_LEPMJ|nr:predicted protein [Plenodomus lingam JN3]CBX93258.1 predicted protein [Plenodomus lingam JN3]
MDTETNVPVHRPQADVQLTVTPDAGVHGVGREEAGVEIWEA